MRGGGAPSPGARPDAAPARAFHEEASLGKAYDGRLLGRLFPVVRPHAGFLLVSLGTLLLLSAAQLVRPLVMGDLVKRADAQDAEGLVREGLVLTALLVVMQTLTFVQTYTMQIAGSRAMGDLRRTLFLFFEKLPLRFYDKTPIGRLVTRATSDVDAVGELFGSGVLNALGDLVSLVGIVVMMLLLDVRLSLIAFASTPLVGLFVNLVRKRSREAFRDIRAKTARLNAFVNEQVNGISVVQAFSRESAMQEEFDGINRAYRDANQRAVYYEALLDAAIEMVGTLCIASALFWAGLSKVTSFALLVTFTQYIRQFFEPISMLSQRYTMMQSAMAGAERIFQLLDTGVESPAVAPQAPMSDEDEGTVIAFDHVGFAYREGTPVLSDVSFRIKKGERIALVGATGAGKSTVMSLLLRLYEVSSGAIWVGGRPLPEWDPRELRRQFSVVPQDVFLFPGTIASNVGLLDPVPDHARVRQALERIGALSHFERREGGLLSPVDARGTNFSAGERQLIAFARALYQDAPYLILDEATASVDSDTEAKLQTALSEVLKDRTSLVVAHRLSTIRDASRIFVFHKGEVVETGTHASLLVKQGMYARLVALAFSSDRGALAEGG